MRSLQKYTFKYAAVAKLADAPALGAGARKGLKVQLLSAAHENEKNNYKQRKL